MQEYYSAVKVTISVQENCIFLSYYATSSVNSLPTFRKKNIGSHLQGSIEGAGLIYFTAKAWNCTRFLEIRHNNHSTLSYSRNNSILLSAMRIFERNQEVICHLYWRQYKIDYFSLTGNNNSVTNSALCEVDGSQLFINKPKYFSLPTKTHLAHLLWLRNT
jgi:hypothetical protein